MRYGYLLLLLLLTSLSLLNQSPDLDPGPGQIVPGELIVQLAPNVRADNWAHDYPDARLERCLSRPLNIWLLRHDPDRLSGERLLFRLRQHPAVTAAQYNHRITDYRALPNDPLLDQQWQYVNTGQSGGLEGADLDADLAWDLSTGGIHGFSDTVVICIIDRGVDIDHPDLVDNLWRNHDEIPDNGIDDDNNGYIDDYYGWNTSQDTPDVDAGNDNHGTAVSGIVGARGDNGIGVTGVNWRVKLMTVRNDFKTSEAQIIAAYSYPLEARQRYNQTGGAEGAFVVATNSSWGIDRGRPEDSPIWCNLFDQLGQAGILNTGAVANLSIDVDLEGDLPTTCPSDFLIGVTNLTDNDLLAPTAAYGTQSVDLGAYGEQVFTTTSGGQYGTFPGTSAATPQVTGAIGLLYALPCPAFRALVASDPAAGALAVKSAILNGTTPNASLQDRTLTGGRLNLRNALDELAAICESCLAPTSIRLVADELTDTLATLTWNTLTIVDTVDLRYRVAGTENWIAIDNVAHPAVLAGLTPCTDYAVQLRAVCNNDIGTSDWSPSFLFRTDGCCEPPQELRFTLLTEDQANLRWDPVLVAESYLLRYRPKGDTAWTTLPASHPEATLTDLETCRRYEWAVATVCPGDTTGFSAPVEFRTTGCSFCLAQNYCVPTRYSSAEEWIARINIGGLLLNNSGPSSQGYTDYGEGVTPDFELGGTYPVLLTPAYDGPAFAEEFKIWIDLDQNGSFTSAEVVYEGVATGGNPAVGDLIIPAEAPTGTTRLRIVMEFQNVSGACSIQEHNGEIEDYCIDLRPPTGECLPPLRIGLENQPGEDYLVEWAVRVAAEMYEYRYRPEGTTTWTTAQTTKNRQILTGLLNCTDYEVEVRSRCGSETSPWIGTRFNSCLDNTTAAPPAPRDWRLYPNPATNRARLEWSGWRVREIQLWDARGRLLNRIPCEQNEGKLDLSLAELPNGLYWVRLMDLKGGFEAIKLLVAH